MSDEIKYKGIFWLVSTLLLIVLVGYNLYSGLTVKKLGIPGFFELEFGQSKTQPTPEIPTEPPGVTQDEIPRTIEELKRELAQKENEQIRIRQEIERLLPLLEKDGDMQSSFESKERQLEEIEMNKQRILNELKSLQENR